MMYKNKPPYFKIQNPENLQQKKILDMYISRSIDLVAVLESGQKKPYWVLVITKS